VILGRQGDRLLRPGGRTIEMGDVLYHAASIISGLYALGGHDDVAMVEERLTVHPVLREVATEGVPDIRVIVYRGIPVMAMTRLPTRRSDGRANLHQGAVGVGIDIATGRTMHAVLTNTPVRRHPDTKHPLLDLELPDFATTLEIAVRATDVTGLGYVGADVVVDAVRGPVVLELNARPGLAVQLANRAGLEPRLLAVEHSWKADMPLAERLLLGQRIAVEHAPREAA
jgi:alpha-L-glutamate ligase-like protein